MNWIEPQRNRLLGHFVKIAMDIKVNEISDGLRTKKIIEDYNQDQQTRILKADTYGLANSNDQLTFFTTINSVITAHIEAMEKM